MSLLSDAITRGIIQLREDIIRASEAAGQRASGRTYDRITTVIEQSGTLIKGEIWAPEYFYTLIRGRGPGKVPANMVDIIQDWAGYKGITFNTPEEQLRFANAVAYNIRKDGSQLYRNHLYVDIVDTPVAMFEAEVEKELDQIMSLTITAAFGTSNFDGHGYII